MRLLSFAELKQPAHRERQPFGQIPSYEEGDLVQFESGAIVMHIGLTHAALLPDDPASRARAIAWMFAAQSTVEPPIVERSTATLLEADRSWHEARLPLLDDRVRTRLVDLANRLGGSDWLEGTFTAGDLMMVAVLRRLHGSGLLDEVPNLAAYVRRGEARPAFQRAFAAQLAIFQDRAGTGD